MRFTTAAAVLTLGLLLGHPRAGFAQDAGPVAPPVILGVSGSFIGDFREFGFFSLGPQILFPASSTDALQLRVELAPHRMSNGTNIDSIYTLQYRHTFGQDSTRPRVYLTAGGAGYMYYSHTKASSYYTPERAKTVSASGVVTSTTPAHWTDVPARTHFEASLPIAPIAGLGIEGHATPRVAFQADVTASVWPGVAFRLSAGMTIAVGRVRK